MVGTRSLRCRVAAAIALVMVALLASTGATAAPVHTASLPASATSDGSWLHLLNEYRVASGVAPVVEEPAWSAGGNAHMVYLRHTPDSLRTGQYASSHTENPASPWYTPEGDAFARSANLGGGDSNDREAIDGWMRAPFHAMGMLRAHLTRAAFARTEGYSGLDVIRGIGAPPATPPTVLFPGPESTTRLFEFTGENPDPREGCAADYDSFRGLPIFAMLPAAPPAGTSATLRTPSGGVIPTGADLCVQTATTYNSSDPIYGSNGESILAGSRAVVVIPRHRLANGRHTVTISRPGYPDLTWSFNVRVPGTAPAEPIVTVPTGAPAGASAVLANIAMVGAPSPGYTTADRCDSLTNGPQSRASGNHDTSEAVANLAAVGVGSNGTFCIYRQVQTDLIVDIQGWFGPSSGLRFTPTPPDRKLDTRAGQIPAAGSIVRVHTGAAAGTQAVLVNLVMADSPAPGYITADRCSQLAAAPQQKASGNHGVGLAVSNLAVVPVDADGSFCIYTQVPSHLVVDLQGAFAPGGQLGFTSVSSSRLVDTRETGPRPAFGNVVRVRTPAPAGSQAVLVNMAMVDAAAPGYITADRCSRLGSGPQNVASGNHRQGGAVSNLGVVPVDADGSFCVYTQLPVHIVVDYQGAFSPGGTLLFTPSAPTRKLDTRG